MNRIPFILLFVAALFTQCNTNPLSHELAIQKISKSYEREPDGLISTVVFESVIRGTDSGYNSKLYNLYINGGLLQLRETEIRENAEPLHIYEITEKGKPYLIKELLSKDGTLSYVVKTFNKQVGQVTEVKYSPDKKEAAAYFFLSIKDLTPFGEGAADPNFKTYLVGYFKLIKNSWELINIEIDLENLWNNIGKA